MLPPTYAQPQANPSAPASLAASAAGVCRQPGLRVLETGNDKHSHMRSDASKILEKRQKNGILLAMGKSKQRRIWNVLNRKR